MKGFVLFFKIACLLLHPTSLANAEIHGYPRCLVPTEAREWVGIGVTDRQLGAARWMLGIEPRTSARVVSNLKH